MEEQFQQRTPGSLCTHSTGTPVGLLSLGALEAMGGVSLEVKVSTEVIRISMVLKTTRVGIDHENFVCTEKMEEAQGLRCGLRHLGWLGRK